MPSWKKIIVSGSNAELNQLTATSYGGNISGSSTSTGSFGQLQVSQSVLDTNRLTLDKSHETSIGIGSSLQSSPPNVTLGIRNASKLSVPRSFSIENAVYSNRLAWGGSGFVFDQSNDIVFKNNAGTEVIKFDIANDGNINVAGNITGSGNLQIAGNISGSATGSFGDLNVDSNGTFGGDLNVGGNITAQNYIVSSSVTSIEYQSLSGSTIFGDSADDTHVFGGNTISGSSTSTGSFGRTEGTSFRYDFDSAGSFEYNNDAISYRNGGSEKFKVDNSQMTTEVVNTGRVKLGGENKVQLDETGVALVISQNDGGMVETFSLTKEGLLELPRANSMVSGSSTSTGSFGRVEATKFVGDGSGITGLTSAAISSYTNNGNNRIITSVNSSTVNGEANLTFDGSTLDVTGDLTLSGDLTVNGTTTTIATTNLQIQDAFGFFATGSAGTNVDAGIIVQSGSYVDSGSAIYHDISKERWSVGKGVASTATNVPDSKWGGFVATVYTGSASPVGAAPKYGVGEIHVDGDGEIYIYS